MLYPVAIEKDRKNGFAVTVPDLRRCRSVGSSMEQALEDVRARLETQLHALLEDGQTPPSPTLIKKLRKKKKFRNCTWAVVDINENRLAGRVRRINITMPERILDMIDRAAAGEGSTRSGFLARAAMDYMARQK